VRVCVLRRQRLLPVPCAAPPAPGSGRVRCCVGSVCVCVCVCYRERGVEGECVSV
jgi:hypothetical protein